jgi:hypothetical protein
MAFDDDVATVATATVARPTAAPGSFLAAVDPCSTVGVSSLPHRDAAAAAEFSLASFDIATLPSLPRRSPAESPVAQALVGASGVTLGQYGTVAVDVRRLDPGAVVCTDLWRDSFTGLRTCLELAEQRGHTGPIKWHFVGPISVGLALRRAGADADVAFSMAAHVVRSHLEALAALIATSLPESPQLVVLDEPFLDDLMSRDFPIAPEEAVDLLSSAMAAVEHRATVGVHACCKVDIATLMASGPKVLSLPARQDLMPYAGYLARFLRNGGWIMWGAVPTEGPIGSSSGRVAARLEALWRELAQRGCDPVRLREQSLISPQCGLGGHSTSVGERVCTTLRDVSRAVRSA